MCGARPTSSATHATASSSPRRRGRLRASIRVAAPRSTTRPPDHHPAARSVHRTQPARRASRTRPPPGSRTPHPAAARRRLRRTGSACARGRDDGWRNPTSPRRTRRDRAAAHAGRGPRSWCDARRRNGPPPARSSAVSCPAPRAPGRPVAPPVPAPSTARRRSPDRAPAPHPSAARLPTHVRPQPGLRPARCARRIPRPCRRRAHVDAGVADSIPTG